MSGPYSTDEVYRLLPAVHRVRDAEQGGVLRELVELLTEQVNVLAESIDTAYDDAFIETCAAWVAPYIGDLVGYRALHGVAPHVASPRAEVANTLRFRRRKGTASMLEQLARDVTDWPARVVESFELLVTTQYVNHVRPHAAATTDLRDAQALEIGGRFQAGAFDGLAHTADMRGIAHGAGRYNISNVAIFLWRVRAHRLARSPLVPADGSLLRYRIDPLGTDKPVYAAPRTEDDVTHLAEPFDVPLPLPRRWLAAHLAAYYGSGRSLLLETDDGSGPRPVPAADVRVCDLSDDPANPGFWIHEPAAGVAVDPVLGRVAFGTAAQPGETRLVTFHAGSALAIGGGGYDRSASIGEADLVVLASGGESLDPALGAVASGGAVQVADNLRYAAPATIAAATPPDGAADRSLTLRSANRTRPLLLAEEPVRLAMEPDTTVVLDGLVLTGAPLVLEESGDASARTLVLRHCTLVPGIGRDASGQPTSVGSAALIVLHPFATVVLEHCVVGPVVAVEGVEVSVSDSVIDACGESEIAFCGRAASAPGELRTVTSATDLLTGDGLEAGGTLSALACTVVGRVHAQRLDVSDSLLLARPAPSPDPWAAPVWAERRQVGCIRFSSVPPSSRTPRRFHCIGDAPADTPHHTSMRYGDAGYAQLRRSTPSAVRTGASDEGSMGVTHEIFEPQRETNLRVRLEEYLRFGLEAGPFYAT